MAHKQHNLHLRETKLNAPGFHTGRGAISGKKNKAPGRKVIPRGRRCLKERLVVKRREQEEFVIHAPGGVCVLTHCSSPEVMLEFTLTTKWDFMPNKQQRHYTTHQHKQQHNTTPSPPQNLHNTISSSPKTPTKLLLE